MTVNLRFSEKGLIPAIVQDADTGDVLMLGYMNEESLRRTLASDEVWFSVAAGRSCGTRERPRAIASWCAQSGMIVTVIPFWLWHTHRSGVPHRQ